MGLDVAQPRPRGVGQRLQCADLVDDVSGEFVRVDLDTAPAEARQIEVTDLRTDPDSPPHGGGAGTGQADGIAGVETAGQVRAADDIEHRLVVAERPHAEALGQVGVEVDGGHQVSLRSGRVVPAAAERPADQVDHERDEGHEHRHRNPGRQRQQDAADGGDLGEDHRCRDGRDR